MALCESWATEADLCSPCNDYALDSGLMEDFLQSASEVLYMASGQQFPGECSETIRPCSTSYASSRPILGNSVAFPFTGCTCGTPDTCGCNNLSQITLPRRDITTIDEVKVDGDILPTTDYRFDPSSFLVSTTDTRWPCCQDLRLDDDQSGTWSVTYTYGTAPPRIGITAVGVLACELYLACEPEAFPGLCRLPRNITSVARQGVSVLVRAVADLFVPHHNRPIPFGIPEIDIFLAAYNPHGSTAPSVILSPDDPDLGRVTG